MMNRQRGITGLIVILGLILGFGIWQQRSQAAGQKWQGVQQVASSATGNGLASPTLRSATAAPMATITVQSLDDGAANAANCPGVNCRLRDAIEKAADGDTINFAVTGTITLNSGELLISKSLTISGPGATQLTISGNNASRVFSIPFGLFNVTFSGLTIANGRDKGADGVGVGVANGSGGGILNYSQETVNVTNCTVVGNSAIGGSGSDGGFFNRGQDGYGGGIFTAYGTMNIINSSLINNSATGGSARGGINTLNIARHGMGGGIYVAQGTVNVINSTLSGNSAIGGEAIGGGGSTSSGGIGLGGGIEADNALVRITNSTLSGNSARGGSAIGGAHSTLSDGNGTGGGIVANESDLTVTGSTLSGNSAIGGAGPSQNGTGSIGGLYNVGLVAIARVRNTIIAGNSDSSGNPDVSGTLDSLGNNLIGNDSGASVTPTTGDLIGTAAAPINPLLAPLGNYGGSTQTRALLPGSPAINAGNNCVLTNTCASDNLGFNLTTDQRGAGFNRKVGSAVDMGAFESRGFTLAIAGGNNQGTVPGSAFALPLSVTVSSANGDPVNGGQVTFTPPASGASASIAGNPATIVGGTATSGTLTSNTIMGGWYTVTASANDATAISFSLTNFDLSNTALTFMPAPAISRQQGSPAGAAVTIGTIRNAQTNAGSVTVTQIPGGTATGITVTGIFNDSGTISALVSAGCTATSGTVRFQVSDGNQTGTGDLTVTVTANAAPTLTYGNVLVTVGASTTKSPTTATDNGSITGYSVQSQGTYTGMISVNAAGVVSLSAAAPGGTHTITIRATDNCGSTTDATFTLLVNSAPMFTPAAAISLQQGSQIVDAIIIGTVSDAETSAGSLTVTKIAGGTATGIFPYNITNGNGTIYMNVAVECTATSGTVRFQVSDGNLTSTGDLMVTVTANTLPTLTYGNVSVNAGASTTNSPTTATDNGGISGYNVQSQGTYTGTISVDAFGVVSLSNAAPAGAHTITIRATDNCGATRDASFTLNVTCPTITVNPSNPTLPVGRAGTPYSQTFTQTGGAGAATFSVSSGALPAGLNLNSGSGLLDGIPTVSGTFNFTMRATDVNGCSGERAYTLLLNQVCVTVNPAILANGFQNTAYSQTLTATGGGSPYSFAVTTGSLPNGLTLASGGALTGLPTTAGTFNFTVTATDNTGCTGARSYTVIISGDGLVFYPLPRPVRILDTRAGQGNCDNISTPIAGGTSLTTLARLTCEGITIPATAKAITGNVTVINQTAQIGFLTIYPDGNALPLAANMIYEPNGILSNNFTVGLSSDGKFNIYGERTLDVVADISGYYAPPTAGALYYHPLPKPVRLLDTRAGQGNCDIVSTPIAAGSSITTLARVTCEGLTIPATAQAIAGNATVINGSGQTGYLTIYPNSVPVPLAANLIYFPGQIISNAFTVSLNASGEFNIFGERTIDMVIDVAGYYSNEAVDANGAGLLLTPLTRPLRILDTRAGQGNCDAVSTPITGGASIATAGRLTCESLTIPASAQSILGNVTIINQTATAGFLTLYPDGVVQPLAANMIYFPNQILSNAFVVGLNSGTGQFRIFAERTLDAIVDVSGFFAP